MGIRYMRAPLKTMKIVLINQMDYIYTQADACFHISLIRNFKGTLPPPYHTRKIIMFGFWIYFQRVLD